MAFIDFPLEELQTYLPTRIEPADFDAFWHKTLTETRVHPLNAQFVPVDYGLRTVETFDVTFSGYGGQPIKGWFILPRERTSPIPCVVEYLGYGGGRNFGFEWLLWASCGFAHLVMDTRGQGSEWSIGHTPDPEIDGANPQYPGMMTRGILNPETYYYRRLFTDAVRAVEVAQSHPAVNATRIAVTGGSQGGGIAIATAGLIPEAVKILMPDVPFLCHYRRATQITNAFPYREIANYLKTHRDNTDTVFNTLSYFDGVNLGTRAKAKALFSVGLMDDVCPPSTVFAAYNHYPAEKDIKVYEYNNHEGGGSFQTKAKIDYITSRWS